MNLGELFIELGVVGDVKPLKEALKTLKQTESVANRDIKLNQLKLKLIKDVTNATTKEEKSLLSATYVQERRNILQNEDIEKTQDAIKGKESLAKSIGENVKKFTAFVGAGIAAVAVIDRMVSSLLRANQVYINFNRQTGLAIDKLNEYATAGAMVDYNLSPESVANSIQSLQSNLAQIRLGQGNIAPYQLLGINPVEQDAFGVLEQLRRSIQGISDIDATNIIQQMGLSPEFISILRLSREEFKQLQDEVFLNSANRQAMNQYAMQLRKIHLQFNLLKDKALLSILPPFVKFMQYIENMVEIWAKLISTLVNFVKASTEVQTVLKGIGIALLAIMVIIHPVIAAFTALYLIIEDIAVFFMGGKSFIGLALAGLQKIGNYVSKSLGNFFDFDSDGNLSFSGMNPNLMSVPMPESRINQSADNRAFNQTNNINVQTSHPVAPTVGNEIISYINTIDQISVFA